MAAAQTMPTLFEVPAAATPEAAEAEAAPAPTPSRVASENSLFELDAELDFLLEQIEDEIEEHGEATPESMNRMQLFCQAMNVKVDRIGHYITMMESRIEHCRKQASRYAQRAARGQNKVDRTKKMVLEYLAIHEMKKIESNDFTLRSQKNSQDSVIIKDPATIPPFLKRFEAKVDGPLWLSAVSQLPEELAAGLTTSVRSQEPSNSVIKAYIANGGEIEGVTVKRESHLRIV
jgi:hypothetical protein